MRENLRNEHVCPPERVIAFACGCQSDLQLEIDNNISLTKYMSIESRIPSKRKKKIVNAFIMVEFTLITFS